MPPYVKEILKAIAVAIAGVIVTYFTSNKDPKAPPPI